jgi:hypothetical protein
LQRLQQASALLAQPLKLCTRFKTCVGRRALRIAWRALLSLCNRRSGSTLQQLHDVAALLLPRQHVGSKSGSAKPDHDQKRSRKKRLFDANI